MMEREQYYLNLILKVKVVLHDWIFEKRCWHLSKIANQTHYEKLTRDEKGKVVKREWLSYDIWRPPIFTGVLPEYWRGEFEKIENAKLKLEKLKEERKTKRDDESVSVGS